MFIQTEDTANADAMRFMPGRDVLGDGQVLYRSPEEAAASPLARRVLALQDRTIGLVAEILQGGRMHGDLRRDVDVLVAASAIVHLTNGARISWANGLLDEQGCRDAIAAAVDLVFRGIGTSGT